MINNTIMDLSNEVYRFLAKTKHSRLNANIVRRIFQTVFDCSLKAEESSFIKFHMVFMPPKDVRKAVPPAPREDYWQAIRFSEEISFDTRNLIKIANATDPRSSSIAVYNSFAGLRIWGLIDEANSYHSMITFEAESGYDRPGLFQVSIHGVGHIVAYVGTEKIAELKQDKLIVCSTSPFFKRPLLTLLDPFLQALFKKAVSKISKSLRSRDLKDMRKYLLEDYHTILCRIILRMQSFKHGGALLLVSDRREHLDVKYKINYTRLNNSFISRIANGYKEHILTDRLFEEFDDHSTNMVSKNLTLMKFIAESSAEDSRASLNAAIWFVSLLSRVDGLVLLDPMLNAYGFGVEITANKQPRQVWLSLDSNGKRLRKIDYNHFGTRHRSMMRYCEEHPGSIGIVVSQDADVRIVSKVHSKLLVWENVKLNLHDFIADLKKTDDKRYADT